MRRRILTAATAGLALFVARAFPSIPRHLAHVAEAMDPAPFWDDLLRPTDPLWTEEVDALVAELDDDEERLEECWLAWEQDCRRAES